MILKGQVAVVTGAGQGIGKAISIRLAREGADVGVLDINENTANKTAEEVRETGTRAVVAKADVSSYDQVKSAVDHFASKFGRIDILVNNAGIEKKAPFLEITPEDWKRQLDVNLTGTFYCSQAVAHQMINRKYGRIINISSVAGLIGPIDLAAYGTSKAGVVGLTRAAAMDLADYGITVNAIAPGPIQTELMLGAWSAEALKERPQHGMVSRFGTVEEIAHTVLFLASPESGYITGITLPVEGGAVAAGGYMVEKYRRRKMKAGNHTA